MIKEVYYVLSSSTTQTITWIRNNKLNPMVYRNIINLESIRGIPRKSNIVYIGDWWSRVDFHEIDEYLNLIDAKIIKENWDIKVY